MMWKLKSKMPVSSRQISHHTISGNISLFQNSNLSEAKNGGAKIVACKFCDKTFSGAIAHILGRPVLGQTKAGIQSCIAINKKR